jgi:hypothetical protein
MRNVIKYSPVQGVLIHGDQEKNSHANERNNMEIIGALCSCFIDVHKMSQKLNGKNKNFSKRFILLAQIIVSRKTSGIEKKFFYIIHMISNNSIKY